MAGRARINQHGGTKPAPSSASLGLPDYPKVDMLGLRYKSVNFFFFFVTLKPRVE